MESFFDNYGDFGVEIFCDIERLCDEIFENFENSIDIVYLMDHYDYVFSDSNLHIGHFLFNEFEYRYINRNRFIDDERIRKILKRTCNKIINYGNLNDITIDFIHMFKLAFTSYDKYNYRNIEVKKFLYKTNSFKLNDNCIEMMLLLPFIFIE